MRFLASFRMADSRLDEKPLTPTRAPTPKVMQARKKIK
jgi:hypothetical protein